MSDEYRKDISSQGREATTRKGAGVPIRSGEAELAVLQELIDSRQLAEKWQLPVSWIRTYTSSRVPKEKRIPHIRFGRYIRFRPGRQLDEWLERQRG
jgi:hypothetical protein